MAADIVAMSRQHQMDRARDRQCIDQMSRIVRDGDWCARGLPTRRMATANSSQCWHEVAASLSAVAFCSHCVRRTSDHACVSRIAVATMRSLCAPCTPAPVETAGGPARLRISASQRLTASLPVPTDRQRAATAFGAAKPSARIRFGPDPLVGAISAASASVSDTAISRCSRRSVRQVVLSRQWPRTAREHWRISACRGSYHAGINRRVPEPGQCAEAEPLAIPTACIKPNPHYSGKAVVSSGVAVRTPLQILIHASHMNTAGAASDLQHHHPCATSIVIFRDITGGSNRRWSASARTSCKVCLPGGKSSRASV